MKFLLVLLISLPLVNAIAVSPPSFDLGTVHVYENKDLIVTLMNTENITQKYTITWPGAKKDFIINGNTQQQFVIPYTVSQNEKEIISIKEEGNISKIIQIPVTVHPLQDSRMNYPLFVFFLIPLPFLAALCFFYKKRGQSLNNSIHSLLSHAKLFKGPRKVAKTVDTKKDI